MRTCLLVPLALTWSCSREGSPAWTESQGVALPPVAREAPSPGDASPEPQDLEPVIMQPGIGSERSPLLEGADAEFSMICSPSFTPEYAVALIASDEPRSGRRFVIRFAGAEPQRHKPLEKGEDPRRHAEAEIDATSASQLQQAWRAVVKRAREPQPVYDYGPDGERREVHRAFIDGTSYRFDCGPLAGTTYMPKAELTSGIVELGEELRKYALLDEAARPAQLARCLELAKKLQAAADKRPW